MRVLLTGESGQLGNECRLLAPAGCDLIAPTIDELDLTQLDNLSASVISLKPDL
jgi:dTDP-4-dehydrorhamnose reductase